MTIQSMAEALAARDAGVQSSANHAETDAPGDSCRGTRMGLREVIKALEDEYKIEGKTDGYIFDTLGSSLGSAYFAAKKVLTEETDDERG